MTIPYAFLAILFAGLVLFASKSLGRICLKSYWTFDHPGIQFATEAGLGLTLVSYVLFALAAMGVMSKVTFYGLYLVLVPLAVLEIYRMSVFRKRRRRLVQISPVLGAGIGIYLFIYLLSLLLPVTARDSLIYHLEVPKRLLENGGFFTFKDNIYAYFPQLMEMLFSLGLETAGESGARIYHGLFGLLLALAFYGFARQYLSRSKSFLCVFLFFSIPSVMVVASWAYVDLTFSCFAFLAFIFVLKNLQRDELKWLCLASLMIGCASCVKYTGIQYGLVLAIFYLISRMKTWSARNFDGLFCLTLPALFLFLPYVLRNLYFTGWPLYPFQTADFVLKPEFNWEAVRADLYLSWLGRFGIPDEGNSFVFSFFSPLLVFIRARFNSPAFYEGVVGPIFFLLPFLWFKNRRWNKAKPYFLFSVLFLYLWAVTTKQVRFLFPILPVLSFLLIYGISKRRQKIAYPIIGFFIVVNLGLGLKEIGSRGLLEYWFQNQSREAYLEKHVEGYSIYQRVNNLLDDSDKVWLIDMKNYFYYLDVPSHADYVFEQYSLERLLEQENAELVLHQYIQKQEITHLLFDELFIASPQFGLESENLTAFKQFVKRFGVKRAGDRRYSLYEIDLSR